MGMMERAGIRRKNTLVCLDSVEQASRGQFFTPLAVAEIMARMPRIPHSGTIKVLDPGAGTGMLSVAMVSYLYQHRPSLKIELTAVENDEKLLGALKDALNDCSSLGVTVRLVSEDYITWALESQERFDIIIENPPYRKLRAGSVHDRKLRNHGIQVPNLYAAFMALGVRQLSVDGQLVVIAPRSWMNGTYYSRFRKDLVGRASFNAIHIFGSRSLVFGDMNVLQESVIVCLTLGKKQSDILLRFSHDPSSRFTERLATVDEVIHSGFIFVPATQNDIDAVACMGQFRHTLDDLGLSVSTGKVVDFRSRDILVDAPDIFSKRLIYSANIINNQVVHPRTTLSKPQWIRCMDDKASKLFCPAGNYVLVKRFSAKEEARRLVSTVWASSEPSAFDNKLNYIHQSNQGLNPMLARGIALWLNSPQVDAYFRVFSGHTQVNATDLRHLKFPSSRALIAVARQNRNPETAFQELVNGNIEAA